MFTITNGSGFHIKFDNGYTVSVQFGLGSYGDHYSLAGIKNFTQDNIHAGEKGSELAEMAILDPQGELLPLKDILNLDYESTVIGYTTPNTLVTLINYVTNLKEN